MEIERTEGFLVQADSAEAAMTFYKRLHAESGFPEPKIGEVKDRGEGVFEILPPGGLEALNRK